MLPKLAQAYTRRGLARHALGLRPLWLADISPPKSLGETLDAWFAPCQGRKPWRGFGAFDGMPFRQYGLNGMRK